MGQVDWADGSFFKKKYFLAVSDYSEHFSKNGFGTGQGGSGWVQVGPKWVKMITLLEGRR